MLVLGGTKSTLKKGELRRYDSQTPPCPPPASLHCPSVCGLVARYTRLRSTNLGTFEESHAPPMERR